jgi:hypothetical protein
MIIYRIVVQYKNGMPDNRAYWFETSKAAYKFRVHMRKSDAEGATRTGLVKKCKIGGKGALRRRDLVSWLTKEKMG